MEAKYIALTLAAKEATRLKLLLTKWELLKAEDQYVKINVSKRNSSTQALKTDIKAREERGNQEIPTSSEYQAEYLAATNDTDNTLKPIIIDESIDPILMKSDN